MPLVRSVAELCQAIWNVEREHDALGLELRGVRIWEAQRFALYMTLAQRAGVFDAETPASPQAAAQPVRRLVKLLPGALARTPWLARGPIDALIVEGARSQHVDGERICIYTHALARELRDGGQRIALWDPPGRQPHDKAADPDRAYLDSVHLLGAARARLAPARFTAAERAKIEGLSRALEARTGVRLDLVSTFSRALARFQADRAVYLRLLERLRPKRVYCVCSYGALAPLMAASRELGIERIELQHGVVSRYHLGYSFPVQPASGLRYFPDRFYSWGGVWDELMRLPLPAEQVVGYGFAHFDRRKARYAGVAREPNTLLVLSQTVIAQQLAELLLRNAPALARFRIRYKLHPSELALWRSYPALVELAKRPNVEVIEQGDLYELMARSEVQLGVFSTALYEGLAFGCRTVLGELPGLEYMQDLLDAGRAELFSTFLASLANP